jgi:signal transduction histidine kinase
MSLGVFFWVVSWYTHPMKRRSVTRTGLLTRGQIVLAITLLLLVIALSGVIVLAYININTAESFQSGYMLSNLANVQREVIALHTETNRVLRDRESNIDPLRQRRLHLGKHLELTRAESISDSRLLGDLRNMEMLLDHYDYEINRLAVNPTEVQFRTSAQQLDRVLGLLEDKIEVLYGSKELEFYATIEEALKLQRTSQALTVGIGGLLLVFGVFLVASIRRSVSGKFERAYSLVMAEVKERRRAEDELRQHNDYLAALHATSLALMNRLNTADLLEAIITRAGHLLGTAHGYVYLVNHAKQTMERKVGTGLFAKSLSYGLERGQGLAGHIWQTGDSLVVDNYGQWPNRVHTPGVQEEIIQSIAGAPLKSGNEIVGVIGLARTAAPDGNESATGFTEREIRLLEGFAQLASIALDNARLFAEADQRALQVEALYRADQELYRHLELEDVLTTLVNVAVDILRVDKSVLLGWNETHALLLPKAARGYREETLDKMRFKPGEGLVGLVAEEAEPIIVQDTTADLRVEWAITYPERIRSFIHVPIMMDEEVFGVFSVAYTVPHAFDGEDLRLILALAQRAASAIQNARLYEQAQQAATLEERQRLARDLHDAVTQTLFSASIIADILPRLLSRDPEEALRRLEELRELTRGALAEMRTLLLELRPTALSETPIGELLQQLGEAVVGRARVPVNVDADVESDLPHEVKVAFYRIAQEALNNIAKHAAAQQVHVSLRCDGKGAHLCIADDGVGFDLHHTRPDNLGLHIMQERAAAVGAQVSVDSAPGSGTRVSMVWGRLAPTLPVEQQSAAPMIQ